jgi:hypothetical protein
VIGLRWKTDERPARHGWAPGEYMNNCRGPGCKVLEDKTFIGAKRAMMCADCAYALPDPCTSAKTGVDQGYSPQVAGRDLGHQCHGSGAIAAHP